MHTVSEPIDAIIGVWARDDLTYYLRRTDNYENYHFSWSLPSIRVDRGHFDRHDLEQAQRRLQLTCDQRLNGEPVRVSRYLTTESSAKNPMNRLVTLDLYEIEFESEPTLNPAYYSDAAWMTQSDYSQRTAELECGLCVRMWADFGYLEGRFDSPFTAWKED